MTEYLKFLAAAVGLALIGLTLRAANKPYGTVFSLLAGLALLLALWDSLGEALRLLKQLAESASLPQGYAALAAKMLGVAFAAEFAAQACRDAGEEGIALRVELSAKLLLVLLSGPLLRQMARLILELTA